MGNIVMNKSISILTRKTLRKSTMTFNYRIVDGHIEFPSYLLLFDKSNKQSTKLKTAVM